MKIEISKTYHSYMMFTSIWYKEKVTGVIVDNEYIPEGITIMFN